MNAVSAPEITPESSSRPHSRSMGDSDVARTLAAPAAAVVAGGRPLHILAANSAALAAFNARDADALSRRLLSPGQPAGVRLLQLADGLQAGAPARLELLRVFLGPRAPTFAFACRKIATAQGDVLVLAATQRPLPGTATGSRPESGGDGAPSWPAPIEPLRDGSPRLAATERVRFVWRTDAEQRIILVDPPLSRFFGETRALAVGHTLPLRLREVGADPEGHVAAAMAALRSWSRMELRWPCAGRADPLRVDVAGTPVFDAARRPLGYRGFGTIHADIAEFPAPSPVETCRARAHAPAATVLPYVMETAADTAPDLAEVGSPAGGACEAPEPSAAVATATVAATAAPQPSPLTASEHSAFDELARDLKAQLDHEQADEAATLPEWAASDSDAGQTAMSVEANDDYAAALDRLPVGVLIGRDGTALYLNRTLLDLLGHADLEAFQQAGGLDAMLRGRAPDAGRDGAVAIARADGETLLVDAHLQSIVWKGAPAIQISIRRSVEAEIAARMAEARAAWQALEHENAELHAVLDTATDGVAVLDSGGHILSINRPGEALFGLDGKEVAGEHFTILLSADSRPAAVEYLDGLGGNGVASVMNDGRDVIGCTRQGGLIPLFMSIGRLPDSKTVRYCAVLRDLTPWKRIESDLGEARRAAERANQLKTDFLARVSHEIRTPLNVILGFAEIMVEERFGPPGNERYKAYLRDIHASGALVMKIVNGLLDLTRIEAGRVEMKFTTVNVNKLVADCVADMRGEADRQRVILRQALAPRLPNVVADDRSLRQIVLNLLSNAIKFNTAGGQVIVSTALTDAGNAVVRIRDTGAGMSESEIKAALEPFQHAATSRGTAGLGVGLPVTKALTEANRATLSIKSRKNEGTLAEVAFPAERVLSG